MTVSLNTMPRRLLATLLAVILALVASVAARGQSITQMVGRPLTTTRFERLLRAYVQPTTDEATALDRLHEVYLDRIRAELEPELAALSKSMGVAMPSRQEFRKFMRDIERVQTRIAEADAALFASCAELVAEERRPGFARMRDARERQRALGGITRMSGMLFAGSGSFVDLADLAIRDRIFESVPVDARPRFDSWLATHDQRLLAQARTFDKAVVKALEAFFEATVAEQAALSADGADAELQADPEAAMQRARESMERTREMMKVTGAEPRKTVKSNFEANRAALKELGGILPQSRLDELRIEVAKRAAGPMGLASIDRGMGGVSPAVVAARMRHDRELADESLAETRRIVAEWRRAHADALEELTGLLLDGGAESLTARMFAPGLDGAEDPELMELTRRIEQGRKTIADAAQKALRALAALDGGRGRSYLNEVNYGEGPLMIGAEWSRGSADGDIGTPPENAGAEETERGFYAGIVRGMIAPEAPDVRSLSVQLGAVGIGPDSLALIEGVQTAWRERVFEVRIAPMSREAIELQQRIWNFEGGDGRRDDDAARAYESFKRRIREEYVAAEDSLFADLAAALGLDSDGPELLALRLERLRMISTGDSPFESNGTRMVTPLDAIVRAQVEPAVARQFVAGALDVWRALLAEIPARLDARAAAQEEVERVHAAMGEGTGDAAELSERVTRAWTKVSELGRADARRVREAFTTALGAIDGAVAAQLARAQRELAYPGLHRPADSASALLERALKVRGASDEQLARLEALKAEYDAVFESLTARMIEETLMIEDTDRSPAAGPEMWQEVMRRSEAIEKIRFQRDERTTKARSEARRILGDELAATVPGLVPDEDEALLAETTDKAFTPFADFLGDEDE